MKVTIDQETKRFLRRWYYVHLMVQLTPEEEAALNSRGLWKEVIYTHQDDDPRDRGMPLRHRVTVKRFLANPYTCKFPNESAAANFAYELKNEHLPYLKGLINLGATPRGPESFEM